MAINSERLYQQFKESGLSRKAFSEKLNLPKSTLDYHLYKVKKQKQTNTEPLISPVRIKTSSSRAIKISLSNGTQIEIPI